MSLLFDSTDDNLDFSEILKGNLLIPKKGKFDPQPEKAALKFKHEFMLNAVNQRGSSITGRNFVDSPPELIRTCKPFSLNEWIDFYFQNAKEQKKNGERVTIEKLKLLGQRLKTRLEDNFSKMELEAPQIDDEIYFAYIYNLTLLRTWDGYFGEESVQMWIEEKFGFCMHSSEEMDAAYGVDRYFEINGDRIGFQIKPNQGLAPMQYLVTQAHENQHAKFREDYGGNVFWVYYDKGGIIIDDKLVGSIDLEIARLSI